MPWGHTGSASRSSCLLGVVSLVHLLLPLDTPLVLVEQLPLDLPLVLLPLHKGLLLEQSLELPLLGTLLSLGQWRSLAMSLLSQLMVLAAVASISSLETGDISHGPLDKPSCFRSKHLVATGPKGGGRASRASGCSPSTSSTELPHIASGLTLPLVQGTKTPRQNMSFKTEKDRET